MFPNSLHRLGQPSETCGLRIKIVRLSHTLRALGALVNLSCALLFATEWAEWRMVLVAQRLRCPPSFFGSHMMSDKQLRKWSARLRYRQMPRCTVNIRSEAYPR